MKLNKNLRLIDTNDKILIVNNSNEYLGEINSNLKILIELLEKNYTYNNIKTFFVNKYNYSEKYVMQNINKIILFLIANDIIYQDI